jgi:hypothetical protein
MYDQCDTEGRQYNLVENIFDHKTDDHVAERANIYTSGDENNQGLTLVCLMERWDNKLGAPGGSQGKPPS